MVENVVLLPINKRHKVVPHAGRKGNNYGMGRSNVWYAKENDAKQYINNIVEYVNSYDGKNWVNEYLTDYNDA